MAHLLPPEDAGPLTLVTRSYFSPQEYRPASNEAPDTEETRKNDEQKIQERQEIKINAGQRH
jgi:hypothetical protein